MRHTLSVAVGFPLLATAAVALAALAWRDRFPAGVASHVGPGGVVDGVASAGAFAATALAVGAGLTLLWGLLARNVRRNPVGLRVVAAAATGSAALLAAGPGALLVTSLDRGTLLGGPAPGWLLPLLLVALGGGSPLGGPSRGAPPRPRPGSPHRRTHPGSSCRRGPGPCGRARSWRRRCWPVPWRWPGWASR